MSSKIENKKELIISFINKNMPKAEIARQIGCNIKTLNANLIKWNVTYQGNQGGENYKTFIHPSYIPYEQYIKEGVVQTNKLRLKLLREGLKIYECECCKLNTWMDKPIPLEIHHIDGNKTNNELSNLQLLCPNCHALTSTYRGKNIKKN